MQKLLCSISFLLITCFLSAQKNTNIVSGPMLGYTELRTAQVWIELKENITKATLLYTNDSSKSLPERKITVITSGEFPNTFLFTATALEPGKKYSYKIILPSSSTPIATGKFTTQQLWRWRKPAPDFSFIAGSCAYLNQDEYDRPGRGRYGQDSSIFETMAKENASFNLWLGDNWYTREADFYSAWGLNYRPSHDRSFPVMQNLLKAMPQFAIWDDHDYGPNNSDASYFLKDAARNTFIKYWSNPSYGEGGQGIYTKITWNDVDIFLLDDRWWRSNDDMMDSINGQPNKDKRMFGAQQMEWLKNALLFSEGDRQIHFRIIATGSQVLNPFSPYDCFRHYSYEYNDLMNFIDENKITGLLFLTGDRHHSEIIKQDRDGLYPLYDITASPFTSSVAKTRDAEINNPDRVGAEIDAQNYARFSFSGDDKNRKLRVDFIGLHGETLGTWSVSAKELEVKK